MANNVFILLIAYISTSQSLTPQLEISSGKLIGTTVTSYGNQTGYAFLNIPFAETPVGELRFRKPVPFKKWEGVFDATKYGNACMANPDRTFKTNEGGKVGPMSEDCLQLNVFTSEYCIKQKSCAVMVVVHGGSFVIESPVIFRSDVIINNFVGQNRNIVVVTVAYRLGIFGLLNISPTMKSSTDANVGMHDLVLGLRWVQKEIAHFGGDSKKVTLYGHSMGGVLVEMLTLSPLTKGLYRAHVSMSSPIPNYSRTVNQKAAEKCAIMVGCAKDAADFSSRVRIEKVIKCLRGKPSKELLDAQLSLDIEGFLGPWVDGEFFPKPIYELLAKRKKLPMMLGTVTGEMRDSRPLATADGVAIPERLEEMCEHVAYDYLFENPPAAKAACQFYYGRPNITQFLTDDLCYFMATIFSANAMTTPTNNVFMYSYSYNGAGLAYKKYQVGSDYGAPKHSEDFIYILGLHRGVFQPRDYEIERIYSGMVANFVNNLDPSPSVYKKWLPWDAEKKTHFHIDFDDNLIMPGMEENYHSDAANLWSNVMPKIAGKPHSLAVFPEHYDHFTISMVEEALTIYWNDDQTVSKPKHDSYLLWRAFISDLKRAYETGDANKYARLNADIFTNVTRYDDKEDEQNTDSQWSYANIVMTVIGSILLIVAVAYAIMKMCSCRKGEESRHLLK